MRISNSKWLSWKNLVFGLNHLLLWWQISVKTYLNRVFSFCRWINGTFPPRKCSVIWICLNLNGALPSRKSFIRAHLLNAKFLFWSWWRSALNEINNLALYLWKISGLALLQHNKHPYILKNAQFIGVFSSKKSYLSIVTSCKRSKRKVNMRQIINNFLYWSWFYQSFLTSF